MATAAARQLLGELLKRHPGKRLYTATKIPPKNRKWPARPEYPLDDVLPGRLHPRIHRDQPAESGRRHVDLQQFHVWDDAWVDDDRWSKAVTTLQGRKVSSAQSASASTAGSRRTAAAPATGLIDAVQVIYNIFDQNPEDELFPACASRTSP